MSTNLVSSTYGSADGEAFYLPGQFASTTTTQSTSVSTAGHVDESAALIAGSRWTSADGGKTMITFSFATAGSQYSGAAAGFASTLQAFSAADQATTRALLASIEAVCNVQFVEVPDNGPDSSGVVRYAYSQQPNAMGYAGYAFFPSNTEIGGDVWIGKAQAGVEWDHYRPNLILHETLHAIGLKHPFEGGAVLSTENNTIANTVMSYSPAPGAQTGALSRYPSEPMPLDVKALQEIYGASDANTGNTTYNLADGAYQGFKALWDAGGSDTLDATGCAQGVQLDLAGGARSNVGASVQAFAYFGSGTGRTVASSSYGDTLAIAPSAEIENATGSAFDDVICGNALANVLRGGGGNDILNGRGGNDIIDGGAGEDTVVFSGSMRSFTVSQAGDHYTVTSLSGGVTTLRNIERVEFADAALAAQQPANSAELTEGLSGQAFRLYRAALDRAPDAQGLEYQTHALESGLSLSQLASNFMASPEFTARFGAPKSQEFVTLLYNNVLGRNPDAAGLAYHTGYLESHTLTRADVLVGFSESPENQAAIVGVGQLGMLVQV